MPGFFKEKHDQENISFLLKSLIYFDVAELADWPVMIRDPKLKWIDVKKRIEREVLDYSHRA